MTGADTPVNPFSAFLAGLDEINRAVRAGEITEAEALHRKAELRGLLSQTTASAVAGTEVQAQAPAWLIATPETAERDPLREAAKPLGKDLPVWSSEGAQQTPSGASVRAGLVFARSAIVLAILAAIVSAVAYHVSH